SEKRLDTLPFSRARRRHQEGRRDATRKGGCPGNLKRRSPRGSSRASSLGMLSAKHPLNHADDLVDVDVLFLLLLNADEPVFILSRTGELDVIEGLPVQAADGAPPPVDAAVEIIDEPTLLVRPNATHRGNGVELRLHGSAKLRVDGSGYGLGFV